MKTSKLEKLALTTILIAAAILRLWRFPSYFPHFWDEAKYLEEIEGIIPHFSVNAGAFAFLKLGYKVFGTLSYPQIVAAVFGVLTVLGCYLLGRRILQGRRDGVYLGLLMAGQAALMPYFIRYSLFAFPAVFALCFFVFALNLYLAKLSYPRVKNAKDQLRYLRISAIAAGLLALVPACSFKFLLPTLILFLVLEILIWRVRKAKHPEFGSVKSLMISVIAGLVLFLAMPLMLATISGYAGWFNRAVTLTESHAAMKTMRLAFHFLYPAHLYYLAGVFFIISVSVGVTILFGETKWNERLGIDRRTSLILLLSCVVSLLIFGLFSHLQSARIYTLTLPFTVYASGVFLLAFRFMFSRFGNLASIILSLLLLVSMGYSSVSYLSRKSNVKSACDIVMQHINKDQTVWANATHQVIYGTYNSRYNKGLHYMVSSFLFEKKEIPDPNNPPLLVFQDGSDLVNTIATLDKLDDLGEIGEVREILQSCWSLTDDAERIFAADLDFYTTPDYYLEDIYSWRSFRYIKELLPVARDSIFVYLPSTTNP